MFHGLVYAEGTRYGVAVWHDCSRQRILQQKNKIGGQGAYLPPKMGVAPPKKIFFFIFKVSFFHHFPGPGRSLSIFGFWSSIEIFLDLEKKIFF